MCGISSGELIVVLLLLIMVLILIRDSRTMAFASRASTFGVTR